MVLLFVNALTDLGIINNIVLIIHKYQLQLTRL